MQQRLEHRVDAAAHGPRERGNVNSFDESVDDLQLDASPLAQLLRHDDDAGEQIAGPHIGRLQLGGEGEELGDRDAAADQRRFELAPGRDKLVEFAFNIEAEQHDTQLF